LRETCGLLTRKDRPRLANCSALHADLFKPVTEARGVGSARDWSDTVERLESLAASRPSIDEASDAQLDWTVRLALLAARRGRDRRRKSLPTPAQRAALARELRDLQREHAELWTLDSRPGGLTHSLSLFDQARAATIAARHAGKRRKR
jgi:acyl-CoA reductase-like NAD-dependent aldehyde dehydrogenase